MLWRLRRSYDTVFVHMNQVYVLLGAPLLRLMGKRIVLWRNHPKGTLATRLAVALSDRVLCTSTASFTARFSTTRLMPVGIDTNLFAPGPVQRDERSVAMVGRVMPSKRVCCEHHTAATPYAAFDEGARNLSLRYRTRRLPQRVHAFHRRHRERGATRIRMTELRLHIGRER
jgi:hypothetical protein